MKPTLFVLAAGMGSRYGGLKQLDGIGPHGETIMDYSIYDAIRCGFGKIVFVIRKDFEEQFREKILSKYENHIPVEVVFQSIDKIPAGIPVNPERAKPWGTNHAVLMGKDVIKEPFAVINADDFYGYDTFRSLAEGLKTIEGKTNQYLMVGFRVANTLSESGGVSRGVCATNADGYLETVTERHDIMRREGGKVSFVADDKQVEIDDNTPVSMNVWGFTPTISLTASAPSSTSCASTVRSLKPSSTSPPWSMSSFRPAPPLAVCSTPPPRGSASPMPPTARWS